MNKKQDILSELKSLGINATEWPMDSGFKVPDGYFPSLKTSIEERLVPQVPDKYFDELKRNILSKTVESIEQPISHKGGKLVTMRWLTTISSVAAVLIFAFFFFRNDPKANDVMDLQFASLDAAAIENYLNENIEDIPMEWMETDGSDFSNLSDYDVLNEYSDLENTYNFQEL